MLTLAVAGAAMLGPASPASRRPATRAPHFTLRIRNPNAITAAEISADVTCPAVGTQTADTALDGLALFGAPVNLVPNTPGGTLLRISGNDRQAGGRAPAPCSVLYMELSVCRWSSSRTLRR